MTCQGGAAMLCFLIHLCALTFLWSRVKYTDCFPRLFYEVSPAMEFVRLDTELEEKTEKPKQMDDGSLVLLCFKAEHLCLGNQRFAYCPLRASRQILHWKSLCCFVLSCAAFCVMPPFSTQHSVSWSTFSPPVYFSVVFHQFIGWSIHWFCLVFFCGCWGGSELTRGDGRLG